jgi:hypothetical protein
MGERRCAHSVLVGKHGERDRFEDPGVVERKILRWIFMK